MLTSFYFLCFWLGIVALFRMYNRKRTVILSYHNVLPDELCDGSLHLGVSHSLSDFRQQIALISAHYQIGTDFHAAGHCVISFDDGYRNNTLAAGHLTSLGLKAIFFVPARPLRDGTIIVIDQVLMWFSYVPPGTYTLHGRDYTITDALRRSAYRRFYEFMLENIGIWDDIRAMLDAAYPLANLPVSPELARLRFTPMSRDELAALKADGHLLGCQSWDHRPLSRLSDSELQKDFARCLEEELIASAGLYCYPYGGLAEVDERVIAACGAAGFRYATLNISPNPFANVDENLALPRFSLDGSNRYTILARLSGLESFLKRFLN